MEVEVYREEVRQAQEHQLAPLLEGHQGEEILEAVVQVEEVAEMVNVLTM